MVNMINKQTIKTTIVMKSKSEMDSKAGINLKERKQGLRNKLSKSASLLLVAALGFSAMSFVQGSASVNSNDTNQHAAKVKATAVVNKSVAPNEASSVTAVAGDPGDDAKATLFISTPGKKARHQADRETIVEFISAVKERRIWSLERRTAVIEADKEMQFNFRLAALYPSSKMVAEADREIAGKFVDDIVHIAAFTANATVRSDAEMAENFVAANLPFAFTKPAADSMLQADAAIIATFEATRRPVIGVPSSVIAQKADEEMMQSYGLQATLTVLK